MLLTLTVCIPETEVEVDIQTSSEQKLQDIIAILMENSMIRGIRSAEEVRIKSDRQKEYLNRFLSLQQAQIFNGDILFIYNK